MNPFELVGAILKLRDVLANVVVNDVTGNHFLAYRRVGGE